jgi:hypothetical protein
MMNRSVRSGLTMGAFVALLALLLLSVAFVADGGVVRGPLIIGGSFLSDMLLLAALLIMFTVVIAVEYRNRRKQSAKMPKEAK